jgi:hypothetical protein
MAKRKNVNPNDIATAKSTIIKLSITFMILAAVTWLLIT